MTKWLIAFGIFFLVGLSGDDAIIDDGVALYPKIEWTHWSDGYQCIALWTNKPDGKVIHPVCAVMWDREHFAYQRTYWDLDYDEYTGDPVLIDEVVYRVLWGKK